MSPFLRDELLTQSYILSLWTSNILSFIITSDHVVTFVNLYFLISTWRLYINKEGIYKRRYNEVAPKYIGGIEGVPTKKAKKKKDL